MAKSLSFTTEKYAVLPREASTPVQELKNIPDQTTPPYTQIYYDEGEFGFVPVDGEMRTLLLDSTAEPDEGEFGFFPTGGELFTATPPELEPDETQFGFVPFGGELKSPPVGNAKDAGQFGFAPNGGSMYAAPQGRAVDNTEFGFAPNGGSLT